MAATSVGQAMGAKVKAIAGTVASASTKVDLTGSYADIGSAINVNGMKDPTFYLAEIANAENAVVKFFLSPDPTQPTASTSLYQLTDSSGAEIEVTIVQNTTQVYSNPFAAYWVFLQGKGAVGTSADLRAFIRGNYAHDGRGSRFVQKKISVVSTTTALTGSAALVGSIVDIRGLGNLTLFVYNSDASVNATITPFVSFADTAPTALSQMYSLDQVSGASKTFVTLANERAAHPLLNVSGNYLALAGSGNGADITAFLFGTLNSHSG